MIPRYDVLVVGAGPGGMAAAVVAAGAGRRVCLVDENAAVGGQIWRGAEHKPKSAQSPVYRLWLEHLQQCGGELWKGWRVVAAPEEGVLRLENGTASRDVAYRKLILATGARERFLPFPGWTLPGVMGAGAAQVFLKYGMEVADKKVVLSGSGPLLLPVAAALTQAGAQLDGIYEQASFSRLAVLGATMLAKPGKLMEGAAYRWQARSAPYRTGCWVTRAEGRDRLERVTVTNGSRQWTVPCDLLACGFHLTPNLELPRLLGCAIHDGCVVVGPGRQSSVPGVACVGELTGVGGMEKALLEGQIAGWFASGHPEQAARLEKQLPAHLRFAQRLERAFHPRAELRALAAPSTIVCRCEDVRHEALRRAASATEARLQSRCGMGACQGRVCGSATEFLFGWSTETLRPPLTPARVETLAEAVAEIEK